MKRHSLLGRCLTALFIASLQFGCQTPRHKEFDSIQVGMKKNEVLEAAGNPSHSGRWRGKDRWIYRYQYHPDGPLTREVHFENGVVSYAGAELQPEITAEEKDRRNEMANEKERRILESHKVERRKTLGVGQPFEDASHSPSHGQKTDPSLQEALYGLEPEVTLEREKKKRAPVFEPIN